MNKQLLQKTGIIGLALGLAMAHASTTYAVDGVPALNVNLNTADSWGFDTLGDAITTIISVIFFVAGLAAFFYILWGAVNYVMAGDDTSKTDNARKKITNAVVGLILVALVYVIWLIAAQIVGIDNMFGGGAGDVPPPLDPSGDPS